MADTKAVQKVGLMADGTADHWAALMAGPWALTTAAPRAVQSADRTADPMVVQWDESLVAHWAAR